MKGDLHERLSILTIATIINPSLKISLPKSSIGSGENLIKT